MSGLLDGGLGARPLEAHLCSRAGCQDRADWALRWRNPRIHDADRHKVWLACAEHLEYLRDFLAARDFPLEVLRLETLLAGDAGDALPSGARAATAPVAGAATAPCADRPRTPGAYR